MRIFEISFSPTGGTKKVSAFLANALMGEVTSVNLTDGKMDFEKISLTQEDIAVMAVPSYAGRVPAVAIERLALIQGHGARAVLVCVYGNRAYEDTLVELEDTVKKAGFCVIAAVAAVAEHSIARQFAAGRPDAKDMEQLSVFARQIQEKISAGDTAEPVLPGNRPYRKAGEVGMVPKPTKACRQCGICARECPVGAIDPQDARKVDKNICISCMRCIRLCPHSARRLNPVMSFAAGFALKKVCSDRKDPELFR